MSIISTPNFYISSLRPFYPTYNAISWSVKPHTITLINPTFHIYRSGTPESNFELIGTTTSYTFEDRNVSMLDLDRDYYYYVETEYQGQTIRTNTRDINGEILSKRLLCNLRKVARDWYLVMSKFNGVPILIYKRRHWGERCTSCYDAITKEVMRECKICFGTSWIGGYFTPLRTWGKFEPPQDANTEGDPAGPVQTTNQVITLLGYPTVEKDDVIFDLKERKMYEIIEKTETQMRRDAVHQTVPTSDLARDNILYKLDTTNYVEFDFEYYYGYPPRASK